MYRVLGMLMVLGLLFTGEGRAQEQPLTSFSAKSLKESLEKQGFKIEDEGGRAGEEILLFKMGKQPVLLFNFGEEKVLMLRYSTKAKLPLEIANSWNTLSTRSRCWVDQKKGAAVVESDLDYTAGVSGKQVENWFKQFNGTVVRFDAVLQKLDK